MKSKILKRVKGVRAVDGAGVNLVRVLGHDTTTSHDPFLMLDSFDSTNYDDYKAGFPTHPHRGIETITYISQGHITHKDSMGNEKTIGSNMIQWMTAGSGIMHSETFKEEKRLLGLQLWLNLPQKDKMANPFYQELSEKDVANFKLDDAHIKVFSGEYGEHKGYTPKYNPLDYYVINLEKGGKVTLNTKDGYTTHLFTLLGEITLNGEDVDEKTDLLLSEGEVEITAKDDVEIVWMASTPLKEEIAWGGPIVMNTREELVTAFNELENGTFIKNKMDL